VSIATRAAPASTQGQPFGYGLSVYRGDSAAWQFVLWADTARTVPVDLTGVTAAAQMRDRPDGLNVTNLAVAVTLPNIVNVSLTATASAAAVTGAWDLQLTYTDGTVTTVVAGPVQVLKDITPG
jgi:hypothetical protein